MEKEVHFVDFYTGYTKLILFRITLDNSYKSIRRPCPLNFSSKFVLGGIEYLLLSTSKLASVTQNWGLFLDSKLFLKITKKIRQGE